MDNEETLKKMIVEARMNDDDILADHLSKALKQITNNKVVETFSNGNTTYTRYKSGRTKVESDYYNIKVKATDSSLKSGLEKVLNEIVIDELRSKKGLEPLSPNSIARLILRAKSQEEIDDIKSFLDDIAKVGPMGNNIKELITEYLKYTDKTFNTENKTDNTMNNTTNNTIEDKQKIENIISSGNTKLIRYESGKKVLESDYFDIKVNSNNSALKSDLTLALGDIAVDELRSSKGLKLESFESIATIVDKAKSQEDINDIKKFLDDIAQVGPMGNTVKNQIIEYINNPNKKLNTTEEININDKPKDNINATNQIKKLAKEVSLLEMRFDEVNQNSLKDPDEYREIAGKYNKAAEEFAGLIQLINDSNKKEEIIRMINNLDNKATQIRVYANKMEELSSSHRI